MLGRSTLFPGIDDIEDRVLFQNLSWLAKNCFSYIACYVLLPCLCRPKAKGLYFVSVTIPVFATESRFFLYWVCYMLSFSVCICIWIVENGKSSFIGVAEIVVMVISSSCVGNLMVLKMLKLKCCCCFWLILYVVCY